MNNNNNELGKGVLALFGNSAENKESKTPAESAYQEINIDLIDPCSDQPRKIFNQEELISLSHSIKENGIIQPLIVVKKDDGRYELIAGERRLRASKIAGLEKVPVVIKNTTSQTKAVMALIENIQRKDLSTLEIAQAYKQLQEEYNISTQELSVKIGVSRSIIANYLRMLSLPEEVKSLLEAEKLTFGHCKVLAGLKGDFLIEMAHKCASQQIPVAKLEKMIKNYQEEKAAGNPPKENSVSENPERYSLEVVSKFKEKLGLNVDSLESKENEGKLVIHYKNKEDLDKILELIKIKE